MKSTRAIYFDAVGTLLFPEPPPHLVYANAARRFGSRYSADEIRARFRAALGAQENIDRAAGWATSEARELARWQDIVASVLDDATDPRSCFAYLYNHFAGARAWRCAVGLKPLFDELERRGYQLGLASNFDRRLHALVGEIKPLGRLAKNVIVSSDAGYRKPAPEFFAAMCAQMGVRASEVLYVGDDLHNDCAGAEAAGMEAALFDPSGTRTDWPGSCIRTLDEVRELLP